MIEMLSPHFSLAELCVTQVRSAANDPSAEVIANLRRLCAELLEPVREIVGVPLMVTSGYRSPAVNAAVGGSKTSAQVHGHAADLHPMRPRTCFELMLALVERLDELPIDQVIFERPAGSTGIHPGNGQAVAQAEASGAGVPRTWSVHLEIPAAAEPRR